jgi:hypothetical protein
MSTNQIINQINVSNLVSPDINNTLNAIKDPKAFGDQLLEAEKQKLKKKLLGIVGQLKDALVEAIKKVADLEINHQKTLLSLSKKRNPPDIILNGEVIKGIPLLTEEEYQIALLNENRNYEKAKSDLEKEKDDLNKKLIKIIADPYKDAKEKIKKAKDNLRKKLNRSKEEKRKARKDLAKQVLKNLKKTLVPIITLVLTEKLIDILSDSERIEELITQTNLIIDSADTKEKINQAKAARDSALNIINNQEKKIQSVLDQILQMEIYITIFDTIVSIILAIPIPSSVPPGIGVPVNLIIKLQRLLATAEKIASGLSLLLAIFIPILEEVITDLENYKQQLHDINDLLDETTVSVLDTNQLSVLLNQITQNQKAIEEYKGFKFVIKEEQTLGVNTAKVVKGFKRHYAAAIDRDGVERIKSEYSFTQEPQILVDQLKLIIDQKNLQG